MLCLGTTGNETRQGFVQKVVRLEGAVPTDDRGGWDRETMEDRKEALVGRVKRIRSPWRCCPVDVLVVFVVNPKGMIVIFAKDKDTLSVQTNHWWPQDCDLDSLLTTTGHHFLYPQEGVAAGCVAAGGATDRGGS